jgi:hypothetical protein
MITAWTHARSLRPQTLHSDGGVSSPPDMSILPDQYLRYLGGDLAKSGIKDLKGTKIVFTESTAFGREGICLIILGGISDWIPTAELGPLQSEDNHNPVSRLAQIVPALRKT